MNTLLNGLKEVNNVGYTENGSKTYRSTMSGLCDLFAMGAAYRSRSVEDCIVLFKKAYDEDPIYALKCLFYLRDCREGQGERRFFREIVRWLVTYYDEDAVKRNLEHFPEYGRYDDWFVLFDTALEKDVLALIKHQLALDIKSYQAGSNEGISLLAKWLPSENASSAETKRLATKVRKYLKMTSRQYRKTLSTLRKRINVLERLMSENRWDEIEFDKIPSKAGFKYRNAFAHHDLERAKSDKNVQTYKDFVKDETKTVNADTVYPYEVVASAADLMGCHSYWTRMNVSMDNTDRLAINKYWDNMKDYFDGKTFNGLCMCDTSGSMYGTPLDVAISLNLYCAERAKGPFANHFISFSRVPRLIETEGVDFCDKVKRIYSYNLCQNTNIEAAFDMLLRTALTNGCKQEDLPQTIIVVSDMEFDAGVDYTHNLGKGSLMEKISKEWEMYGYKMPNLIYWNVNARNNNIPMQMKDGITFVSGMSPVIFEQVLTGKTGLDFVLNKLDSERYAVIK